MTDTLHSPTDELTAQDAAEVSAVWLADLVTAAKSGSAAEIGRAHV